MLLVLAKMAFNISLLAAEVKKSKYSLIPYLSENGETELNHPCALSLF